MNEVQNPGERGRQTISVYCFLDEDKFARSGPESAKLESFKQMTLRSFVVSFPFQRFFKNLARFL